MKLKSQGLLLLPLLALEFLLFSQALSAKPKVDVRIRVTEGLGKYPPQDSLNKHNAPVAGPLISSEIYYFNVTVLSDNTEAVAKNSGQWCIKGEVYLSSFEYHGTLTGNDLVIEVPQKNGKMSKVSFGIYDHKWRKLADI